MKTLFACVTALTGAYVASPYVALYLMGQALRAGDARSLLADVVWNKVRDGLKADIADGITGQPVAEPVSQSAASDDLPPFGSGMVTGIATNLVDRAVTPEHLLQSVAALREAGARTGATIVTAHFVAPLRFEVAFRAPGEKPDDPPIELGLRLEASQWGAAWRVVHASVPVSVLTRIDGSAS